MGKRDRSGSKKLKAPEEDTQNGVMTFFTDLAPSPGLLERLEETCGKILSVPCSAHVALATEERIAALADLSILELDSTGTSAAEFAAMCDACGRDFLLLCSVGRLFSKSMDWDSMVSVLATLTEPQSSSDGEDTWQSVGPSSTRGSFCELLEKLEGLAEEDGESSVLQAQLCGAFGREDLLLAQAAMRVMAAAYSWGCAGLGMGPCSASDLLRLAEPLLKWGRSKFSSKSEPSVEKLLPLLELLRAHPCVDARVADLDGGKLLAYDEAWERWLARHPELSPYMDPNYVLVVGPNPAQLAAVQATVPFRHSLELGLFGVPFPQLYRCQNANEKLAVAGIYRAAFAHDAAVVAAHTAAPANPLQPPLGGNPANPVAFVCHFPTAAGRLFFL